MKITTNVFLLRKTNNLNKVTKTIIFPTLLLLAASHSAVAQSLASINAKQDYDRFTVLLAKDAVTKQQYDNAHTRYLAAKARYEQAQGRRQSAASVKAVQTHELGGQRAGESVAEAQVRLARLNLSYTVVDDTKTRFHGVLSLALLHRAWQYVAIAVDNRTPYIYMSVVAGDELAHGRHNVLHSIVPDANHA